MAAPSGQLKASRYFLAMVGILLLLYALVFFTGDRQPLPRLGLDLKGGMTMTLSAALPGGKVPDAGKLEQAREIIASRVDATGVSEPEVVIEGDRNIVVNVAGQTTEEELRKLVAPAEMRFRQVLAQVPDTSVESTEDGEQQTEDGVPASSSASGSASPTSSASPSAAPVLPKSAAPSTAPSPSASASPLDESVEVRQKAVLAKIGKSIRGPLEELAQRPLTEDEALQGIQQALAQLDDPSKLDPQLAEVLAGTFGALSPDEVAVLPTDFQLKVPSVTCKMLDARPAGSVADITQQVVACGTESSGRTKYLLEKAKVVGEDVSGASADNDPSQGGWFVTLDFKTGNEIAGLKGNGQDRWTSLTKEAFDNNEQQVAIVLDNQVVSAPSIKGVINAQAQITGSFTQAEAQTLARQLKFGSLPVSFAVQSVDSVTATLGLQQMKAGLLAGGIGLALVVVYCMIYYRALGLVVVLSLAVASALVYASLVLLGRHISYSLSLAGIAGFIVAIGITADSFVVYFERLKDEVKEGRTVRSAVPRAWARARRTILSADAVSLLAATVLYLLAIGAVKGFAFTLGLSTIIDVIIVFLFTHPLVVVASRSATFASPRISGLGDLRPAAAAAPARQSASRVRSPRTKES